MVLPLLIGAGAALGGALISSRATKKASQASQQATDKALALQREQGAQTQANLRPYMDAGQPGLEALAGRLEPGAGNFGNVSDPSYTNPGSFSYGRDDYTASPAYQFQLDQGLNAIQSSMANRGALGSGATLKALQGYGQNLAYQNFGAERGFAADQFNNDRNFNRGIYEGDRGYLTNRYDTQTGTAANLATIGGNAAAGAGNAGMAYANNAGNLLMGNASNQANAGLVGASNTNNLIGQGLNAYMYSQGMGQNPAAMATAYTPPRSPSTFGGGFSPGAGSTMASMLGRWG